MTRLNKYNYAGSILILLAMLFSCTDHNMYHHYESIKSSAWNEHEAYLFDVEVSDTLSVYDVFIEIRNNDSYPYENLWLFVSFETPWNNRRKDTLDCRLADPYGQWFGKGFSQYTLSVPYEKSVVFPRSGTYSYTIRQGMREEKLKGITDIGVRISPAQR